jgi:hypothetical protein
MNEDSQAASAEMMKAQSTSMMVSRVMVYSELVAGQSSIRTVIGAKEDSGSSSIFQAIGGLLVYSNHHPTSSSEHRGLIST